MIETIGVELRNTSYYATSWEALGLPYDEVLAEEVIATCSENAIRPPQEEVQRSARGTSPACVAAAQRLVRPIVESLFVGDEYENARNNWFLFGVNYYERGDVFPRHHDFKKPELSTVVIASLTGIRRLKVEGSPPITTAPGSITLLNGATNPEHQAWCVEAPSISVVASVPDILY